MKLSIVSTLYYSSSHLAEFYHRTTEAARRVTEDYEILLVNDGSPDDALALALTLSKQDSHVVIVDLSRNFGHHNAMLTGLGYTKGDRVFLIDSDLEEDPGWLSLFSTHMDERSSDMVYGVQDARKGGWYERLSGRCFYAFFRLLTGLDLPKDFVTARLMSRRYLNALLSFQEREVFLGGLMLITGFDQHAVSVHKISRSKTTYTLRRKLYLLANSITSFTNTPLIAIFFIGAAIFAAAVLMTFLLLLRWMFYAKPLMGWTSVVMSIWLLGGLMISFIGVVGIYLAKVFSEVKRRPYAIVKAVYGR